MNSIHIPLTHTIRKFNHFYSNVLGHMDQYIVKSEFSPAEVCVLYETDIIQDCTAKKLSLELNMDAGYLSRILKRLIAHNLVYKSRSLEDGRLYYLHLTKEGKKSLSELEALYNEHIYSFTAQLQEKNKKRLIDGMKMIEDALAENFLLLKKRPKLLKQAEK